jgi:hypothetical protein
MRRFNVTHDEAVWERSSFVATVPDFVQDDEVRDWILDNLPALMGAAHDAKYLTIEVVGSVDSFDDEVTIEEVT